MLSGKPYFLHKESHCRYVKKVASKDYLGMLKKRLFGKLSIVNMLLVVAGNLEKVFTEDQHNYEALSKYEEVE